MKVIHLTSVHAARDTRIFHKECRTLAAAGYEVVLVAPHQRDETEHGTRIRPIKPPATRWQRLTRVVTQICQAAIREDGDLYHFHDPELIPLGWLLKLRGKQVVFDVHEDYETSIRQKSYLPHWCSALLAAVWRSFERVATSPFEIILAEKYYRERFPDGVAILNYPSLDILPKPTQRRHIPPRLVYTGTLREDRGALTYAQLAAMVPDIDVHIVGRCSEALRRRMITAAGAAKDRLHLEVTPTGVSYSRIASCYREPWLAGLALFPPTPHYMRKELTKFFEYMASGIPILCSDFPVWRDLVLGNDCGLCVDPENPAAIAHAISWLRDHAAEARAMGRRGRQAVLERYNWESQGRKLLAFYDDLLGDGGARL